MCCRDHARWDTRCRLGLVHHRDHGPSRARWSCSPSAPRQCQSCQHIWIGSQSSEDGRVACNSSHRCSIQGPRVRASQGWCTCQTQ
jgi:hypothetical protein